MKIIRGGLLFILVLGLFFSLLVGNLFVSLAYSLEYENIYTELSSTIIEISPEMSYVSSYLDANYSKMVDYCSLKDNYLYRYKNSRFNVSCVSIETSFNSILLEVKSEENFSLEFLSNFSEDLKLNYSKMINYCSPKETYYFSPLKKNLSCSKILDSKEEFKFDLINDSVSSVYYKNYSCDFWNCLSKTGSPMFLVSEKASNYWTVKFYSTLIFSLILLLIIFFLLEEKINLFFVTGFSLLISALPLLKVESFLYILLKPVMYTFDFLKYIDSSIMMSIFSVFFSKASSVFYSVLIISISLIVIGLILKFWSIITGRTKKMFSSRDIKELVNKEIKREIEQSKEKKFSKKK